MEKMNKEQTKEGSSLSERFYAWLMESATRSYEANRKRIENGFYL